MSTPVERVRQVIDASGMTQGDFATAVGLDAPKMSKSLGGARRFTSLDLANIAEVGGVTVDWLLSGVEPPLALAARAAAGSTAGTAVSEARRLLELRESAARLGYPRQIPGGPLQGRGTWRAQGEELAEAALERCRGVGLSPWVGDLADVVETAFNVDVAIVELGESFDGLAARSTAGGMILASPTPVAARQRFTIAHELGHLLTGDDQELHADQDIRSAASRQGEGEVRANAFAAAFLMPAERLRELAGRGRLDEDSFARMAVELRVSPSALALRLDGLRLVDGMAAARLKRMTYAEAVTRAGAATPAAEAAEASVRRRAPGLLTRDLLDAYLAGKATLRPYAAALGVDPDEVRAQFEGVD